LAARLGGDALKKLRLAGAGACGEAAHAGKRGAHGIPRLSAA